MKRLSILGCTGSIGVSTLSVVESMPERFRVAALAGGTNVDRVEEQARRFRPECVSVRDEDAAAELAKRLGSDFRVVHGATGLLDVATHPDADLVVSAIVGAIGLEPTHAALAAGRDVALANKEVLVVAGEHITKCAERTGARILPVDSEHNALHQCLRGERMDEVRRLWLTASGGPFRRTTADELARVTPREALCHPTWNMGPKITIDSATMMNKGLEVIEARWLFGVPGDRIRVVIHPTSVVHSMAEFVDGSFKAQLGVTDMRHPIQYALSWPERLESVLPEFDPVERGSLEFERPDTDRFPCLALAYRALEQGGAAPAALNAANEVAVQAFLDGRTGFLDIPAVISTVLDRLAGSPSGSLEELLAVDAEARVEAGKILRQGARS